MNSKTAGREGAFYKGNPTCPRCGGSDTVCLGEPWWECVGRVLREVVPETVAHSPVPIYGRCGHRFDVEELAARHEAERKEAEARRQEDERWRGKARKTTRLLAEVDDPRALLEVLGDEGPVDERIELESLKAAWVRTVSTGSVLGAEEIVTLDGRPTALGFLQRHLAGGTEWGTWREAARLAAFSAPWREMERLPAFDTPLRQLEASLAKGGSDYRDRIGVDLVLDEAGDIWRVGLFTTEAFENSMRGFRVSRNLMVAAGEDIEFRRRRRHRLWFTYFKNAGDVHPFDTDASLYCLAVRVALTRSLQGSIRPG